MADEIQPAAAAPAEPAAPVTPAAPATPAEPAAPTADEAADAAEAQAWDDAAKEIFPGLKSTQKAKEEDKKPDEPAKPVEKPAEAKAPAEAEIDPNETPEQKKAREDAAAAAAVEDEEDGDENAELDSASRDARSVAREAARQVEAIKLDVRKQMFANVPQVLSDADGDPIRGIEDVMRLRNPATGEGFTQEEAGMWLLSAQQKFNQSLASIETQITQIAETNADIKDQADAVSYRYGALLKEMPDLRDDLWAEYEKTLQKDPESGIIVKAPVSLEKFYEVALRPYATVAQKAEQDEANATKVADDAKAAEDAKKAADAEKASKRADRSDIWGGGKVDEMDDEEAAWAKAAEVVFGPRKK